MSALFLLSTLIILLLLGFPVFLALLIPGVLELIFFQNFTETSIIVQRMISGVNSFTMLALPLFIFAADIIARGVSGNKIVDLTNELLASLKGGVAISVVAASAVFGAISGSGTASMLALGGVFLASLRQANYNDRFSFGIISVSSSLSSVIPPGVAMILYATITGTSVKSVFLAGLSVGIILSVALALYSIYYAFKNKVEISNNFNFKRLSKSFKDSFLVLLTPVIILGGIYGGFVTPTEAAVLAILYIFILEVFIYRSFPIKEIFGIAYESAKTSVMIMILLASGTLLSWAITTAQIPHAIGVFVQNIHPSLILLMIIIVFLILGMFMDGFSAMVIIVPMILPVVEQQLGIDPAYFGVLIVLNTAIGTNTPPFGLHIFAGMSKFKASFGMMAKACLPFVILSLVILFLITYFPSIGLWLPNLLDK